MVIAYRVLTDCGILPNQQVTAEYQEPTPEDTGKKRFIADISGKVLFSGTNPFARDTAPAVEGLSESGVAERVASMKGELVPSSTN
ncbi:MAG: hypothetical protein WB795_21715 [Candidatus Acidiferrales bacterium]